MRIYICSIKELEDAASYDAASLKIGQERKEKLVSIKNSKDKKRSVAAGLLLNFALYQYRCNVPKSGVAEKELAHKIQELSLQELLEVPKQEYICKQAEGGKPYLADESGFFFSLSHSGEYVCCAQAAFEIGVDLQSCDRRVTDMLARKVMTDREYAAYVCLPEEGKKERFYRFWAVKESGCKLTGKGLSQGFQTMEVCWEEKKLIFIEDGKKANFDIGIWKSDYVLAVCSQ